jgi:hypothetical protein
VLSDGSIRPLDGFGVFEGFGVAENFGVGFGVGFLRSNAEGGIASGIPSALTEN